MLSYIQPVLAPIRPAACPSKEGTCGPFTQQSGGGLRPVTLSNQNLVFENLFISKVPKVFKLILITFAPLIAHNGKGL